MSAHDDAELVDYEEDNEHEEVKDNENKDVKK